MIELGPDKLQTGEDQQCNRRDPQYEPINRCLFHQHSPYSMNVSESRHVNRIIERESWPSFPCLPCLSKWQWSPRSSNSARCAKQMSGCAEDKADSATDNGLQLETPNPSTENRFCQSCRPARVGGCPANTCRRCYQSDHAKAKAGGSDRNLT